MSKIFSLDSSDDYTYYDIDKDISLLHHHLSKSYAKILIDSI